MKLKTRIRLLCASALVGMVMLAHAFLERLYAREQAGELTREQAQAEAKTTIGNLREDELYFFVRGFSNDVNYVHPNPKRIVGSVKRVTDIVAEISAASQEQTTGIEQVNVAIAQMDQATQQNAALVEQASAAALSLRQQSEHLVTAVSTFA